MLAMEKWLSQRYTWNTLHVALSVYNIDFVLLVKIVLFPLIWWFVLLCFLINRLVREPCFWTFSLSTVKVMGHFHNLEMSRSRLYVVVFCKLYFDNYHKTYCLQLIKFSFSLWTAYSSMVEGKNEEMSTDQLSGGARIHFIFQNIFVKSLEVYLVTHFVAN